MANENALRKNLDDFQKAFKQLGDSVNKSGIEWNDAQYYNLSNSIRAVAASSKQVIILGRQSIASINRFNLIESEK